MPRPRKDAPPGYEHMMAYLDEHSFQLEAASLALQSARRDDARRASRRSDAGIRHDQPALRRAEISLCLHDVAEPGWFLFNGFVKNDLETGREHANISWRRAAMRARRRSRRASAAMRRRRRLSGQLRHRREHRHVRMHPARRARISRTAPSAASRCRTSSAAARIPAGRTANISAMVWRKAVRGMPSLKIADVA